MIRNIGLNLKEDKMEVRTHAHLPKRIGGLLETVIGKKKKTLRRCKMTVGIKTCKVIWPPPRSFLEVMFKIFLCTKDRWPPL